MSFIRFRLKAPGPVLVYQRLWSKVWRQYAFIDAHFVQIPPLIYEAGSDWRIHVDLHAFEENYAIYILPQVCRIVWPQVMAYIAAPPIVPRSTMYDTGWLSLSLYGSNSMTSAVESVTILCYRKFVTQTQPIGTSDNASEWSIIICIVAVFKCATSPTSNMWFWQKSRRPLLFSLQLRQRRVPRACLPSMSLLRSFVVRLQQGRPGKMVERVVSCILVFSQFLPNIFWHLRGYSCSTLARVKVKSWQSNSTSLTTGAWPSQTPAGSWLAGEPGLILLIGWAQGALSCYYRGCQPQGRKSGTWPRGIPRAWSHCAVSKSRGRLVCRSGGATITPSSGCQELLSVDWLALGKEFSISVYEIFTDV